MPVSTSFVHREGYAGDIASTAYTMIEGGLEENTNGLAGTLGFGLALVRGATFPQLVLPTATGQACVGISLRNLRLGIDNFDFPLDNEGNLVHAMGYTAGALVSRVTSGDMFVQVEAVITPGQPAYFRHTAAAAPLDQLGRFTDTASAEHDRLPTAYFKRMTSDTSIAILNLGTAIIA